MRRGSRASTPAEAWNGPPPPLLDNLPHSVASAFTSSIASIRRRTGWIVARPISSSAPLVHDAGVEVADLAFHPGAARKVLDDLAQLKLGAIGEFGEGAVTDTVGRNFGPLQPRAVREPIEIVLRTDGAVE